MAPTSEDLHDLVSKLEARVQQLEAKLKETTGGAKSSPSADGSIRMILMGPPGAGMLSNLRASRHLRRDGYDLGIANSSLQARARKHQSSRRSSPAVIWYGLVS